MLEISYVDKTTKKQMENYVILLINISLQLFLVLVFFLIKNINLIISKIFLYYNYICIQMNKSNNK